MAKKKEKKAASKGGLSFERALKQAGSLENLQQQIDSGKISLRGRAQQKYDATVSREQLQKNPLYSQELGGYLRQLGGGILNDKFKDVLAFQGIGKSLFPDEAFSPLAQDQRAEDLSNTYTGQLGEANRAVNQGLGSLAGQESQLSPELTASLQAVSKGAVNDPALVAASQAANQQANDYLARAGQERQIDPQQQAIIDELMRRSKGFTPEEQNAYLGQLETSISANQQAAQRQAAEAGARGIRGGLANDLNYRALQDALMARASGRENMVLQGRTLGDTALGQAGDVAGTAVGQARQSYGTFAGLGQAQQQNSGNLLQQAVQAGQGLYGQNISRANNAATSLGNINASRGNLINAGSGAANAASSFLNPYLASRQNIDIYNKQLPLLKGQTQANFILGGLGYATDKEAQDRANQLTNQFLQAYQKNAGQNFNFTVNNSTNSQQGSSAPLAK